VEMFTFHFCRPKSATTGLEIIFQGLTRVLFMVEPKMIGDPSPTTSDRMSKIEQSLEI